VETEKGKERKTARTRATGGKEWAVEHVADGRSGDVVLGAETQRRAAGVAAGSARETGDVGGRWQSI